MFSRARAKHVTWANVREKKYLSCGAIEPGRKQCRDGNGRGLAADLWRRGLGD